MEENGVPFKPRAEYGWEASHTMHAAAATFVTSLEIYNRHVSVSDFTFHGPDGEVIPPSISWASDPKVVAAMVGTLNRGVPDSIHNGGTCSIGTVVDQRTFKVCGLHNLRVADLSVFPSNLPGNTMSAAFTIGRFVARYIVACASPELTTAASFKERHTQLSVEFGWNKWRHLRMTPVLHPDLSGLDVYEMTHAVSMGYYRHEIWPSVWLHQMGCAAASFASFLGGRFLPPLLPRSTCKLFLELCVPAGMHLMVTMETAEGFCIGASVSSSSWHPTIASRSLHALNSSVDATSWSNLQLSYTQSTGLFSVRIDEKLAASHVAQPRARFASFRLNAEGASCEPVRVRNVYAS